MMTEIHLGEQSLPDILGRDKINERGEDGIHLENNYLETEQMGNPQKKIKVINETILNPSDIEKYRNLEPELENPLCLSELNGDSLNNITFEFIDEAISTGVNCEQASKPKTENVIKKSMKEKPQKPRAYDSRYTASLLSSATESYKEAQEQNNSSLFEIAGSIRQLSAAVSDFNGVFRSYVEIENTKAEAELINANARLIEAQASQIMARLQTMKYLDQQD